MVGRPGKKPYQDTGYELGKQQYPPGDFLIKIKDSSKQKKERNRIVDQVVEIGMNKRRRKDANQPAESAWKDAKIIKIEAISNLVI